MVAVDGRQPGYSTGVTNFELAQTIASLGAVTAMRARLGRFDHEPPSTDKLLNRPSDPGGERAVGGRPLPLLLRRPCAAADAARPLAERRRHRRVAER